MAVREKKKDDEKEVGKRRGACRKDGRKGEEGMVREVKEDIGALVSEVRELSRARRKVKRKFSETELLIFSGDSHRIVRILYNG